ncbi:MAG: NAD(P)/FAD-dependent oxidoreductase [Methylococcaceae bacterium]|nr:NAD(P)/FAD-dependent oxidoreductase [Methylococcaceae bacterium]
MKIVIIGAGPAGSSCATQLLKSGVEVVLLDRENFPRHAPGETLHPGIEPLLEQLGVLDLVNQKEFIRHEGIFNISEDKSTFTPYDEDKKWKGFQLFRKEFDSILLNNAIELGADFLSESSPVSIKLTPQNQIESISTSNKKLVGDFFIDATGKRAWLVNRLKIPFKNYSPKRIAYYGYVEANDSLDLKNPKMIWDKGGWTWIAKVKKNQVSWVRLDLNGQGKKDKNWLPKELRRFQPIKMSKAVDVTWRMAEIVSDKNYFFLGDATFVLDPAASHGVLKAIMSGIMVSHLIVNSETSNINDMHKTYYNWLNQWFIKDKDELNKLYKTLTTFKNLEVENFSKENQGESKRIHGV